MSNGQVALKWGERLFTKNTDRRKVERLSMAVDACSLPVPEHPVQGEKGLVKSGGNSDPRSQGGSQNLAICWKPGWFMLRRT